MPNRTERRKLSRKMKGQNVIMNPDDSKQVNNKNDAFCKLHKLNLDNIDKPTPRDEKLIESVKFRVSQTEDKEGNITTVKVCPRCSQTITIATYKPSLIN